MTYKTIGIPHQFSVRVMDENGNEIEAELSSHLNPYSGEDGIDIRIDLAAYLQKIITQRPETAGMANTPSKQDLAETTKPGD